MHIDIKPNDEENKEICRAVAIRVATSKYFAGFKNLFKDSTLVDSTLSEKGKEECQKN